MRVVYVLHSSNPYEGSSKAFLSYIFRIRDLGVVPHVIVPDMSGIGEKLVADGISVSALNYRTATYPKVKTAKDAILWLPRLLGRIYVNLKATRKLCTICRNFGAQIVHSNVSVVDIGYRASKKLKIPHVWHIREYGDLDFGYHYIFCRKQQLARYHTPLSYSICITKGIQRHQGLAGTPTSKVIYDGAIEATPQNISHPQSGYFLFVGRIEKAKGIEQLIDAYVLYIKRCKHPIPLYVAGDTPNKLYKQQIKEKINGYRLDNNISLLGMRDNVEQLYSGARALIMSSLFEGFGLVTAEAMSAGCLVIGNDTAGTKEQFDNGKEKSGCEIALRYTTTEQLVQHMIDVTDAPADHYDSMRIAAREVVTELYTKDKNVEHIFHFYNEIISEK